MLRISDHLLELRLMNSQLPARSILGLNHRQLELNLVPEFLITRPFLNHLLFQLPVPPPRLLAQFLPSSYFFREFPVPINHVIVLDVGSGDGGLEVFVGL